MRDYAAVPGVNWSSLKHMSVSPRMYKYRQANPEAQKPAFVLGGAIHCMVLEPETFDSRYVVLDAATINEAAPPRNTKEGKALIAERPEWATSAMTSDEYQAARIAEVYAGKQALTERTYATVRAAARSVREHRVARDLLRGGCVEEALTWTDEHTGIACKGRLDYLRPDMVIDLKSSRDPALAKFEKAAIDYGYAAQLAYYHDGARAAKRCTGARRPCVIVVRTKDDFDVGVYELSTDLLNFGRRVYQLLLAKLAVCIEADYWPGVAPEIRALNLPPWAESGIINNEQSEEI